MAHPKVRNKISHFSSRLMYCYRNFASLTMSTSAGKILLVDDDASFRRVLHTILNSLGFEVAESPDGEQGLCEAEI